MPLFAPKSLASLAELHGHLADITSNGTAIRWYRGQGSASWKITPSITRPPFSIEKEVPLVKRFKQNAYASLPSPPADIWEWLFLMQHHGAPTRLLDWTENPLVAAYFAVNDPDPALKAVDACVWCLDPIQLNMGAGVQSTDASDLPFFGIDADLDAYTTDLVSTVKTMKPPAAGLAPRFFKRVVAQAGVFSIVHRDTTPLETSKTGEACVGMIKIPAASKDKIKAELSALGITRLALFPELESVAIHAKEALK